MLTAKDDRDKRTETKRFVACDSSRRHIAVCNGIEIHICSRATISNKRGRHNKRWRLPHIFIGRHWTFARFLSIRMLRYCTLNLEIILTAICVRRNALCCATVCTCARVFIYVKATLMTENVDRILMKEIFLTAVIEKSCARTISFLFQVFFCFSIGFLILAQKLPSDCPIYSLCFHINHMFDLRWI